MMREEEKVTHVMRWGSTSGSISCLCSTTVDSDESMHLLYLERICFMLQQHRLESISDKVCTCSSVNQNRDQQGKHKKGKASSSKQHPDSLQSGMDFGGWGTGGDPP